MGKSQVVVTGDLSIAVDAAARELARPFVKMAGGKTQLLPELDKYVPEKFGRYFEPFVGGGALFYHLSAGGRLKHGAVLGDVNARLIATYRGVRDDVRGVRTKLAAYAGLYRKLGEKFYYATRAKTPATTKGDAWTAAWSIFLNKTCYNGMFRENRAGQFNVPHGKFKSPPTICDESNLLACSHVLQAVSLVDVDFEHCVENFVVRPAGVRVAVRAERDDFVYLDCPYWPVGGYADFTEYTKSPFGPVQQERLRDVALRLKGRGVHVLLSNADVPEVRKLYAKSFSIRRVEARRSINSKTSKRGAVGELLIW